MGAHNSSYRHGKMVHINISKEIRYLKYRVPREVPKTLFSWRPIHKEHVSSPKFIAFRRARAGRRKTKLVSLLAALSLFKWLTDVTEDHILNNDIIRPEKRSYTSEQGPLGVPEDRAQKCDVLASIM